MALSPRGSDCHVSLSHPVRPTFVTKRIAVDAALRYRWNAETEVTERMAKGEQWRADGLPQKARSRVVIEIKRSS